ncbi:ECE2 (predicted) [Pycnogonum litorale]
MSKTMINVFNETLASLSWMDDKTRKNAFKKLNSFIYTMGYRSGILNKTVMTKFLASFKFTDNPYENRKQLLVSEFMEFADYLGKPIDRRIFRIYGSVAHKIDAYYHPVLNTAIVTAGLVNAFYSLRNPQFRNYAKIGAIFLHEVTHGFDSSGRERDHNGILNNWWSAQSLKNFNERVDCIVNQFNNYTFFGQKLNGKQTLMENIADSGIRLAYLVSSFFITFK